MKSLDRFYACIVQFIAVPRRNVSGVVVISNGPAVLLRSAAVRKEGVVLSKLPFLTCRKKE